MSTEIKVVSIVDPKIRQILNCYETPQVVIGHLFRTHRIKSYKSIENILQGNGFLDNYETSLRINESPDISKMSIFDFNEETILKESMNEKPISDFEVKKRLVDCMNQYVVPKTAINYFGSWNVQRIRKQHKDWFLQMDEKTDEFVEATSSMLGITSREDLKLIYFNY